VDECKPLIRGDEPRGLRVRAVHRRIPVPQRAVQALPLDAQRMRRVVRGTGRWGYGKRCTLNSKPYNRNPKP